MKTLKLHTVPALACLSAALLFGFAGCKSKPATADDSALTSSVQTQLSSDGSLTGLPIQAAVQDGIATLNGTVNNDAQRELAARDASGVTGVRTVVNNLTVQTASASISTPAPAPAPVYNEKPSAIPRDNRRLQNQNQPQPPPAPIERVQNQPPPPPPPPAQAAPPSEPAARNITLEPSTTIPVRITQTLDSATTQEGETFSGVVASDIVVDGIVVIRQGAPVSGRVDEVHEAGHFKGNSLLTVSLTNVRHLPVSTEPYSLEGKGRGKNTAEKTGIGAVGGAILGGIFGGGKGAAIGAAAGGGVGAGSNAITRGQQVQIPSESVVRFRTSAPLTVRVGGPRQGEDGELQHRNS